MNNKAKTHIWLFSFALLVFLGPFAAVLAIEGNKKPTIVADETPLSILDLPAASESSLAPEIPTVTPSQEASIPAPSQPTSAAPPAPTKQAPTPGPAKKPKASTKTKTS